MHADETQYGVCSAPLLPAQGHAHLDHVSDILYFVALLRPIIYLGGDFGWRTYVGLPIVAVQAALGWWKTASHFDGIRREIRCGRGGGGGRAQPTRPEAPSGLWVCCGKAAAPPPPRPQRISRTGGVTKQEQEAIGILLNCFAGKRGGIVLNETFFLKPNRHIPYCIQHRAHAVAQFPLGLGVGKIGVAGQGIEGVGRVKGRLLTQLII